jgi:putative membrane protein
MLYLLLRWLINALALIIVARLVPNVRIETFFDALLAALVLGFINATIRWVLIVLTLPINLVTLGLFTFVINAFMILLASRVLQGFEVTGFAAAFSMAILLWLISLLTNWFLGGGE